MPKRFLALLAPLAALAVAAAVAAPPVSPSARGGPSASAPSASAPAGKGGAPEGGPARKGAVRFRKGTLAAVDLDAGTLVLRVPGEAGGDEEYPAGGTVPLGSLRPGDNVVVTVKGGTAVSVRPFRAVPKSLRALPPHKGSNLLGKPPVPPAIPSRSPVPLPGAPPPPSAPRPPAPN